MDNDRLKKSNEFLTSELDRLKKENEWYNKKYGPYIAERGLDNWKNLFRKPNLLEWTILIMLLLSLFMGWAYQRDIEVYKQTILEKSCEICAIQTKVVSNPTNDYNIPNLNNLLVNEENQTESGEG